MPLMGGVVVMRNGLMPTLRRRRSRPAAGFSAPPRVPSCCFPPVLIEGAVDD